MHEYIIYQHIYNEVKTVNSRTVSTTKKPLELWLELSGGILGFLVILKFKNEMPREYVLTRCFQKVSNRI